MGSERKETKALTRDEDQNITTKRSSKKTARYSPDHSKAGKKRARHSSDLRKPGKKTAKKSKSSSEKQAKAQVICVQVTVMVLCIKQ